MAKRLCLLIVSSLLVLLLAVFGCTKASVSTDEDTPGDIESKVKYKLAEGVQIIPQSNLETIRDTTTVRNDRFSDGSFKASMENLDGFGPGRQFIFKPCEAYPNGLIGKISNMDYSAGKYWYKKLKLEEVFESLDLQASGDISPYVEEILGPDGKPIDFTKTKAIGRDFIRLSLPKTRFRNWDESIVVTAEGKIDLPMLLSIVVDDFTLINASFKVNPTMDISLDMDANVSASVVETKYPFLTVICGAFIVGPVVITPLIQISLYISAEGKIGMTGAVSYKQTTTLQMIYDNNTGFSADSNVLSNEEEEPVKLSNTTLYMEGNLYTGLDMSAGIGVFGDALYGTIGVQKKVKCGGRCEFDLSRFNGSFDSFYRATSHSRFYTDLSTQSIAALNTFGGKMLGNVKGAEKTEPLDSLFFLPTLTARLKDSATQDDSGVKVEITAEQRTLLPYDIGYRIYKLTPNDGGYDAMGPDYFYADPKTYEEITLGAHSIAPGEKSKVYTLDFRFDEAAKYRVCPTITLGGKIYELPKADYSCFFNHDGQTVKVFQDILREIAKSLKTVPEDWFSKLPTSDWTGVTISSIDSHPHMNLDLAGLEFGNSLEITDHSSKGKYSWELSHISSAAANLTYVDIQDRNYLAGSFNTGNLIYFALASDIYRERYPFTHDYRNSPLETLELKGKMPGVTSLSFYKVYYPKLKQVDLESLQELTLVDFDEARGYEVKFTADKCPKLTSVSVFDKGADINRISASMPDGQKWEIYNQELDSFTLNDRFAYMWMVNCKVKAMTVTSSTVYEFRLQESEFDTLDFNGYTGDDISYHIDRDICLCTIHAMTVRNCPNATVIGLSHNSAQTNLLVGSLDISGCPKLTNIYLDNLNMTHFSLDAAGSVRKIYIEHNCITAVVPSVFDQIRDLGGDVRYDLLYDYDYRPARRRDYGYYYPGEPDSGGHIRP